MLKKLIALLLFTVLPLVAVRGEQGMARADDVSISSAPVLSIHSTGGTIHIYQSDAAAVHVQPGIAAQRINITRFSPGAFTSTPILPAQQMCRPVGRFFRCYRFPARQFTVPRSLYGSEGVNIENPGGDMSVGVPARVGAIFINAEQGNVAIDKLRGPFVIAAAHGDVHLKNVVGRGLIRTSSGNVTLVGVGGEIHVQTLSGSVTVFGSFAGKADVQTATGPITFRFARIGTGAYSFRSREGAIHLQFLPSVAAQVDAQTQGSIYNMLPGAPPIATPQHAMSLPINGGGSEVTAASQSGDITIEQVTPLPVASASPQQ